MASETELVRLFSARLVVTAERRNGGPRRYVASLTGLESGGRVYGASYGVPLFAIVRAYVAAVKRGRALDMAPTPIEDSPYADA